MNPVAKLLMKMQTKSKELRAGLIASINAAYTEKEIKEILLRTNLSDFEIFKNPFSLIVKGIKK